MLQTYPYKTRSLVVTGILAVTSMLMVSGPASAAPAAPPPSCVVASVNNERVSVTNTCSIEQRVKVLVAFGPDSACTSLASNGGNFSHELEPHVPVGPDPRFDGLESC